MGAGTDNAGSVIVAPVRIVAETRGEFRTAALDHVSRADPTERILVIDMEQTVEVDASGLGILVLIQKRAKERGMSTRLRRPPERVRNLLKLTMLDFLFEFMD